MTQKRLIELGIRSVSRRGGSLQVTIPSRVAQIMNLEPEDLVVFYYDPETRRIILGRISKKQIESIKILEFSIPEEKSEA